MKKRYEWRILGDDGVLLDPIIEDLNGITRGFETEADAVDAYVACNKKYIYVPSELVLLTVYDANSFN